MINGSHESNLDVNHTIMHSKEDRATSLIRRKPRITYKSPTAEDHLCFSIPTTRTPTRTPSTKPSPPCSSKTHTEVRDTRYNRRVVYPTLPLFHPLGNLAMSLPPLDPNEYGLPPLSTPDDRDLGPQSRFRRTTAKKAEAEEDGNGAAGSTVSNIPAVVEREVKERGSPRKRRAGGAKRKRKDAADDGDATYPAKRTRMARGGGGQGGENESVADLMEMNESAIGGIAVSEGVCDPTEGGMRRSRRTKGSLKRRDSGASETPSITANGETPNTDTMAVTGSHKDQSQGGEDREEGELSDGAKT